MDNTIITKRHMRAATVIVHRALDQEHWRDAPDQIAIPALRQTRHDGCAILADMREALYWQNTAAWMQAWTRWKHRNPRVAWDTLMFQVAQVMEEL